MPALELGVLETITRVSVEQASSHGDRNECGLVPTQVAKDKACLQSDGGGSRRLLWMLDFRSCVLLVAIGL